MTWPEVLARQAARHPQRLAVVDATQALTYAQLWLAVQQLAAHLHTQVPEPRLRVGLWADNSVDWIVADLAILTAGLVSVPVHASLPVPTIQAQFAFAQVQFVLTDTPQRTTQLGTWPECRGVQTIAAARTVSAPGRAFAPQPLATLLFTSGTTGTPRAVLLTHANLLSNVQAAQAVLPYPPAAVVLGWLPLSHIFGRQCNELQCLWTGATLHLTPVAEVRTRLPEVQPHHVHGVPHFFARHAEADFGARLRWLHVGGAPLAPALETLYAQRGLPLYQGYGLTEASPILTLNTPTHHRAGTVGRPLPGVQVRVADDGELWARGPNVLVGYWREPTPLIEGWLPTGDLATIDTAGFVTLQGRKKELLALTTGRKVAPNALETQLLSVPGVAQVVLVGDGQPYVAALVGLTEPLTPDAVLARWQPLMAHWAAWEQVRRVACLPARLNVADGTLTPTLKVCRPAVHARWAALIAQLYRQP
jgi:long-chain acyl-CoA synthetase